LPRRLESAEKEQFVPDDPVAECPAELITLESVVPGSKGVPGVHVAVAKELEQIAMHAVRA